MSWASAIIAGDEYTHQGGKGYGGRGDKNLDSIGPFFIVRTEGDRDMFNIWVSIALLGLWSCVGVMYHNSRKASRQLDEIVRLLGRIAEQK
jgi:hypothetical protein